MEFKGTKGNWKAKKNNAYWDVQSDLDINDTYFSVNCMMFKGEKNEDYCLSKENEANAKLIASAPDLLEALISIENDDNSIPKAIWDMRNKAIEKALK